MGLIVKSNMPRNFAAALAAVAMVPALVVGTATSQAQQQQQRRDAPKQAQPAQRAPVELSLVGNWQGNVAFDNQKFALDIEFRNDQTYTYTIVGQADKKGDGRYSNEAGAISFNNFIWVGPTTGIQVDKSQFVAAADGSVRLPVRVQRDSRFQQASMVLSRRGPAAEKKADARTPEQAIRKEAGLAVGQPATFR